jgi:putative transcriptional regulator
MILVESGPIHHPEASALLDYAAGKTSEAASLLVATHLALCPSCRSDVRRFEQIGGVLVEAEQPVKIADGALAAVLARLDEDEVDPGIAEQTAVDVDAETLHLVPQPLRGYLKGGLSTLAWRQRARGIREASIEIGDPEIRASMLRIAPGEAIPAHTHDGLETTIVLKGAYSDSTGRYARGDVATAMDDLDHAPVAETDEECVCFIVVEGDLKLTGRFGRVLNMFVRP